MATLNDVIQDVIFEEKTQQLKLFYNIDVFIQEFKDDEDKKTEPDNTEEPEATAGAESGTEPAGEPAAAETGTTQESVSQEGTYLSEAVYKRNVNGELIVPKEEAMNIQTLQDLVDYLSDKEHQGEGKTSSIRKVLGKKPEKEAKGKIISPTIQEIILILAGAGEGELGDIINKGDKVIVEVKYGKDKYDNIGFKINKNSGTDVFSIMLIKDGEILAGQFDQTLINKQILYFRNSIA